MKCINVEDIVNEIDAIYADKPGSVPVVEFPDIATLRRFVKTFTLISFPPFTFEPLIMINYFNTVQRWGEYHKLAFYMKGKIDPDIVTIKVTPSPDAAS